MDLPPPPVLADDVVRLRPFTMGDAPAVTEACQDPSISRYTRIPHPYTEADARAWLESVPEEWRKGRSAALAIEDAASGELIGSIALVAIYEHDLRAEVGYWTAKPARRRGVATRALRLLAGWAFDEAGLHRLDVLVHPDNEASQGVPERAGFTREGLLRGFMRIKGESHDFVMWSLLATDPRGVE